MPPVYSGRCESCRVYNSIYSVEYTQVVTKECKECHKESRFTIDIQAEMGHA